MSPRSALAVTNGWDVARAAIAPAAALLGIVVGVVVGWLVGRGVERLETRRDSYVEWLRAAEAFRSPVSQSAHGQFVARRNFDRAMAEVELVASRRVLRSVRAYTATAETWEPPNTPDGDAAAESFRGHTNAQYEEVLKAMRRDLHTKR